MAKLHELLAAEKTVVHAGDATVGQVADKFARYNQYYTGHIRTLQRIKDSPEDKKIEEAGRQHKALPTTVREDLDYAFKFLGKAMDLRFQKHMTNQVATANIEVDGELLVANAPVDFLLDLEAQLPKIRTLLLNMPVLDPSKEWTTERVGVWRTKNEIVTAQTEKKAFPVVLYEATDKHPAQVKESTRDEVVGTFHQTDFSGAATSQQKADSIAMVDKILTAVKEARMRANNVDVTPPSLAGKVILDKIYSEVTR